jgi:hypothetical protein
MLQALPALEVTPQFKDQFLDEVTALEMWAETQFRDGRIQNMLDSIGLIRVIVETTDLAEHEISFG